MRYASINGKLVLESEAMIPVTDRGFQFGEGCFTTIRVSKGKPEWLEDHFDRLSRDSAELGIPAPRIGEALIRAVIEANEATKGTWRLKVILTAGGNSVVLIAPYEVPKAPARLGLLQAPPQSPFFRVKRLAYLDRFWMQTQAIRDGFDDYVGIDESGHLLEATFANLVWHDKGIWKTPDWTGLPIMRGIALSRLVDAPQLGHFRLEDIPTNANVYVCNVLHYLRPVKSIAGRSFPVVPKKTGLAP